MNLESLVIVHLSKRKVEEGNLRTTLALLDPLFERAFRIETCQRVLWVSFKEALPSVIPVLAELERLRGERAYRFLLEATTGLKSEVRGEADVFGQIKQAWAEANSVGGEVAQSLAPWMQKAFEDTKEIRSSCLQNIGSSSYGSLVRRLIRQYANSPAEPVLVLGAGQIAKSIVPWLAEREVWLWNRSRRGLDDLIQELRVKNPNAKIRFIETEEDEAEAFRRAAHLVVCIPFEEAGDARRIRLWREGSAGHAYDRAVIHLGGLRAQSGQWQGVASFHALDDLFAIQKAQEDDRDERFTRAFRACAERAKLRAMSGSISGSLSLPHGWEDLAAFA